MYTLWFINLYSQPGFNTEESLYMLQLVLSPVPEAESVEGLFDVLIGLCASSGADAEYFAVRDILLQLSLAKEHSAFIPLYPGTRQQEVGSVAPTLQQCG